MISDVTYAVKAVVAAVAKFNSYWPTHVEEGAVWRLPLISDGKAGERIPVEKITGKSAVEAATNAIGSFYREPGQFPGTVLRLPGWFALRQNVVDLVLEVMAAKKTLEQTIEATRLELDMPPSQRTNILRCATSNTISNKQLLRSPQAFNAQPRLLVFTWAGATPGVQRIPVATVREKLNHSAELQAARFNVPQHDTEAAAELRAIANLSEDACLLRYKKLAPHPRLMIYLSESTTYDAMIHANLPTFVLAGSQMEVRELQNFDTLERSKQRKDSKKRILAVPSLNLYLRSEDLAGTAPAAETGARELEVQSTYGAELL